MHLRLAGTEITIPHLGLGTWAWGDKATWGMDGYDASLTTASIREAFLASVEAGVTFLDTAEVYGKGRSEQIIGELLAAGDVARDEAQIATKFMPFPWRLDVRRSLRASLRASLDRLGVDAVDLYQVHGPISARGHGAMADALAAVHAEGWTCAVGVSNYSVKELRAIHGALAERGIALATNQVEYSLLRTMPERVGLLDACAELGVIVLAYSPIGQGRLTGKYSATNPPSGRRTFSAHPMATVDAIVAELRRIGEAHDGATPSQVALAWIIAKGAVPIPGAKNRDQAEQNAGALHVELDATEVAALDAVALFGTRGIAQRVWQHG